MQGKPYTHEAIAIVAHLCCGQSLHLLFKWLHEICILTFAAFHPLGSPTFSTFSLFDSKQEKGVKTKPKRSRLMTKSSSEPNLLDDSTSSELPQTFTKTEPSHISRLLRESTPHTALTGSTVSLVPAPSLTHSTPSQSSLLTQPHTKTLKPVYIVPPEVEKVEVRTSRSPQILRKPPSPLPTTVQRLNSATSVSSLGSACSGQRHHSDSCEHALTMDTDQPSPVFRTIARVKGEQYQYMFCPYGS